MRVIELSNHPAQLLRETRDRRMAAQARERSRVEDAVAEHEARLQRTRAERDLARAGRRWGAWLRGILAVRRERRRAPAPPAGPAGRASDQEEILAAGMTGENLIAAGLGRRLDDDWTLLRGYRNRGGEIDHLLLGPRGIVAIEGKHRNATVHCDGDAWRFEKSDRYGNLVERGQVTDGRGRSPSAQLNEPADLLEEFLRSRGHHVPVQRVVLLTHPRSRIGTCRKPTVHIATSAEYVINLLNGSPPVLKAGELARLRQLITGDHKFHQSRRSR
jgi:hypothetical protein